MAERFESQFGRVIGGSDEEKKKGLEKYTEWLNESDDDIRDEFKSLEIQKSPEGVNLIKETEEAVDAMVKEWGGDPKPTPVDKVHIVQKDAVFEISKGAFSTGYHSQETQKIIVEQGLSKIAFLQTLAHEFFHKKSYKDAQVYDRRRTMGDHLYGRRGTKAYRSGLNMVDRKNPKAQIGEEDIYFHEIEEAIVASSTHKFMEKYLSNDPRYAEAFVNAKKVKDWLSKVPEMFPKEAAADSAMQKKIDNLKYFLALEGDGARELVEVLEGSRDNDYKWGFTVGRLKLLYEKGLLVYADRIEEVENLEKLCGEIVAKSEGKFKTNDEVFDLFARANYGGNMLTLGKTIEKTLGKGSFRRVAEDSKKAGEKRTLMQRIKEFFWG
jgi:hypothetical protein